MISSDSFSIHSERNGRIHRITPTGELDLATAPILGQAFDTIHNRDDNTIIVVDLTEVSFIDSSGLHALLRIDAACEGDQLRVINGSPAVERLLDVAGLHERLPIISKHTNPLAPLWRRRRPGVGGMRG